MSSKISVNDKQVKVCVASHEPFSYADEDNLLIAMQRQQIDVHYHCKEGFCGACRTKLISGSVDYVIDPLAFIDDDEILVCCCIPTSDLHLEIY